MGRKENLIKAKETYKDIMQQISSDKNKWKEFLDFSSKFYKYSFTENLLMFAQNPKVTMCATLEEWNSIGRWVKPNSTSIKILKDTENEIALDYVFDVSDTYARRDIPNAYTDEKLQIFKWKATEQQVIDILNFHFKNENLDNLETIVADYMTTAIDDSGILLNLTDEEELIVLKSEFLELMIKNTTYQVATRCGIKIENTERIFSEYETFANSVAINIIGNCINYCSSELLKIIEFKMKKIKREELKYGDTRKIWNNSEEKLERTLSNEVQRINYKGNSNGETIRERTGNIETERNNRETTQREESSTKDERIYSDGEIQSNDREYDRRIVTANVRRKNLENNGKEVEKSTSFSFLKNENEQLGFETLFELSYQQDDIIEKEEHSKNEFVSEYMKFNTIMQNDKIIEKQAEKINYAIPQEKRTEIRNARQRVNDNIKAIKLLKDIESQGRLATREEQEILALYSGWGGLSKIFNKNNEEWKAEEIELNKNLTVEELEEAKSSSLNAFYTNPEIIDSMYLALSRLGFKGGNILEPSARNRKFYRQISG